MSTLEEDDGVRPSVGRERWTALVSDLRIVGALAASAMVVGAVLARVAPCSGYDAILRAFHLTHGSTRVTVTHAVGVVLLYGSMAVFCLMWLKLGPMVSRGEMTQRQLFELLVWWSVPLCLGPGLFSHDLYSYAGQGAMVAANINPYHNGPVSLGYGNHFTLAVDQVWKTTSAPYGPFWYGLAGAAVTLFGSLGTLPTVLVIRLFSVAGVVLLGVYLPRLARQYGRSETWAIWLALLNPLVVLHFVAGGHNDALMMGLVVAALVEARERRPALGILLCSLAAMVKAPALAAAFFIGLDWALGRPTWRQRVRTGAMAVGLAVASLVAVTAVFGIGWGWVPALATPGKIESLLSPTTAIGVFLARIGSVFGLGIGRAPAIAAVRVVGFAVALALCVAVTFRFARSPARATALALLAVTVLGPVVQPWYLLWWIVLIPAIEEEWVGALLVWPSVILSFAHVPSGHSPEPLALVMMLLSFGALLYPWRPTLVADIVAARQ